MQRIDKLLIKAKRACGQTDKQLSIAIIDLVREGEHKGEWQARADLWDGELESCQPEDAIISYHSTQEEAIKAVEAVAEAYPPKGRRKQEVPIIINDLS